MWLLLFQNSINIICSIIIRFFSHYTNNSFLRRANKDDNNQLSVRFFFIAPKRTYLSFSLVRFLCICRSLYIVFNYLGE